MIQQPRIHITPYHRLVSLTLAKVLLLNNMELVPTLTPNIQLTSFPITSIQGYNISLDQYFTFMSLAEWALEKKFTIVGTMRHDRKGIPKESKSVNDREEKSVLYVYHEEKNVMLVSYIDKKKSGKKTVIVFTTMHDKVKVTNDQRTKPHVPVMYDHRKGDVDIVDLFSTDHSTRIKSKRWPLNVLAFILDICRPMLKQSSETTTSRLQILSLHMSLKKLLSCQAFNDNLRIQTAFRSKSSTK